MTLLLDQFSFNMQLHFSALPNTALYQFEATSGLYYDPTTGLYYDGNNSRYYYNTETQKWLYWDGNYCTFLPCEGQTAAASDASATTSSEQLQEEGKDEKVFFE